MKNSFSLLVFLLFWTCSAAFLFGSNRQTITNNALLSKSCHNGLRPRSALYLQHQCLESESIMDSSTEQAQTRNCQFRNPVHTNVCAQTGVTLSRYMMDMERLNPELQELESIFTSIQVGCKAISKLVRNSSLQSNTGLAGNVNVQGEEQKKMDVLANDVLKNALQWAGHFKTIASEEEEEPLVGFMHEDGKPEALIDSTASYIAVFDPLDGSSNIDAGIPVGTIFGIFQHREDCGLNDENDMCLDDVLQPGKELVAAGYCLYSSATTLVFTLGDGTHGFTLDESLGEFVLTHPNMKIPKRGSIYSFNEGNRWDWDQAVQDYISSIQKGQGESGVRYSGRYVGSMVADIHRTLQYGGIFGYPADTRNLNGKLRLLYEAAPMAFIVEQAGGTATTGTRPIMNVLPTDVHARVPCILGSRDDVAELQRHYERTTSTLQPNKNPSSSSDNNADADDSYSYFGI